MPETTQSAEKVGLEPTGPVKGTPFQGVAIAAMRLLQGVLATLSAEPS